MTHTNGFTRPGRPRVRRPVAGRTPGQRGLTLVERPRRAMAEPVRPSGGPDQRGFTLIELLVVLVIIGVVASIAVPQFSETRNMAYYAALRADLRNLAAQQELYYASHYKYSAHEDSLGFVRSAGVDSLAVAVASAGWSATATHRGLGDATKGCGIFSGNAAAAGLRGGPTDPGVVACTK